MSINKAILLGNVGKDPEFRTTANGKKIAVLSLATEDSWKDANGERQKRTEWHRIVVFAPGLVKIIEAHVKKGSKISVEGKIVTRKWTGNDGRENYTTEIVLEPYSGKLTLEGQRGGGERTSGDRREPVTTAASRGGYDDGFYGSQYGQEDDNVPF